MIASAAVNVVPTRSGRVRLVCQVCGLLSRSLPSAGLADLPHGWSVAPFPATYVHPDGSSGDLFICATCRARRDFPIAPREYLRR